MTKNIFTKFMETNMTGKDIQITVIVCMFINPQSPATSNSSIFQLYQLSSMMYCKTYSSQNVMDISENLMGNDEVPSYK
jgi:hypothetical protein